MIFSVKDSLRQAVEAASGGLATVMYTKKGQPVFLRRIPRFNLEDIDPSLGTGPHPAFVVNGETKSEVWIGMYPGVISQGELVSVPGVAPTADSYANLSAAARAAGPGFHLVTRAEWAAVSYLHWQANGQQEVVRGATDWGRSHVAPWEVGVRVDGRNPGEPTGSPIVLTGSGPITWRHDGTPVGISDMVYPLHWLAGVRLVNGEVQIIPDNDAAVNDGSGWMAINASGQLVPPGTANTLKFDIPSGANYTDNNVAEAINGLRLRTTRTAPPAGWDENSVNQDYAQVSASVGPAVDPGITIPPIMRALGLILPQGFAGIYLVRPYGLRALQSGFRSLLAPYLTNTPNASSYSRPAFVL